jgi:hypothetical protein
MKSYTQHIKHMYNRKQTFMSISINTHTQRTTQRHESESTSSINPNNCTWVFLHSSLLLFYAPMLLTMLQCTNEGVYIPFPSFFQKLSNLILNSIYLFHLNINASIYFRRERGAQGLITLHQVHLFLNDFI